MRQKMTKAHEEKKNEENERARAKEEEKIIQLLFNNC